MKLSFITCTPRDYSGFRRRSVIATIIMGRLSRGMF